MERDWKNKVSERGDFVYMTVNPERSLLKWRDKNGKKKEKRDNYNNNLLANFAYVFSKVLDTHGFNLILLTYETCP